MELLEDKNEKYWYKLYFNYYMYYEWSFVKKMV